METGTRWISAAWRWTSWRSWATLSSDTCPASLCGYASAYTQVDSTTSELCLLFHSLPSNGTIHLHLVLTRIFNVKSLNLCLKTDLNTVCVQVLVQQVLWVLRCPDIVYLETQSTQRLVWSQQDTVSGQIHTCRDILWPNPLPLIFMQPTAMIDLCDICIVLRPHCPHAIRQPINQLH